MLSSILVPFDGSKLAEREFPDAAALAHAGGAQLILLYVRTGTGQSAAVDTLRNGGVTVEPVVYQADRSEVGRALCRAPSSARPN